MQEVVKDLTETVSIKAERRNELSGKGSEATFTRTKTNRARLLRRSTSQCLLLNENQKDSDRGRTRLDSTLSSTSSGLLFARPLSSSNKKQAKPFLFPRPKTSLMSATGPPRPNKTKESSDSDSDRPVRKANSKPLLARRSSYFSLQSLRRSISVNSGDEGSVRRLTKRGSREEKGGKFGRGFKGMVTAIDEEEREEKRQLVSLYARLCRF